MGNYTFDETDMGKISSCPGNYINYFAMTGIQNQTFPNRFRLQLLLAVSELRWPF